MGHPCMSWLCDRINGDQHYFWGCVLMNWNARFRNKTFWVALTSAIILLFQQIGWDVLPVNITEIVNTILSILVILGVIVDPTTSGITDNKGGE